MLKSTVCRYEHFLSPWYAKWAGSLGFDIPVTTANTTSYRKIWEWCAILQALEERGMLHAGRRGIGFAVGTESLPSVLAHRGVEVLATDMHEGSVADHWKDGNQHATSLDALFHSNHCSKDAFHSRVTFQPVDMRDIGHLPGEAFDFAWSSCAIEHLGDLAAGMNFVRNSMRLLRPGGISVHTTEFNCSSNDATFADGWNVLYRRQDLEELDRSLRPMRCGIETFDFDVGTEHHDLAFDPEPYFQTENRHIKLQFGPFVATSFLIIARKAG